MEVARKGDTLALRLDHGDDILRSIGRSIEAERSTMSIVAGLGMISEFELGYFDEGTMSKPTSKRLTSCYRCKGLCRQKETRGYTSM